MPLDPRLLFGLPAPELSQADAVILPLPFEKTVTYGTGTERGPEAILAASLQVELFDEETQVDFAERPRVFTLPPLWPEAIHTAANVPDYLDLVRRKVREHRDRFLVALGGEHTVTCGVAPAMVDDPARLTIVHIDAHGDLIDELGGRRWSHGTAMRRLWDLGCRLIQIGIRSVSRSEYELIRSGDRIQTFYGHELPERWPEVIETIGNLRGDVFLSFDVDGLDPAVIPSTGTPQPGGLSWRQAMEAVRTLAFAPQCRWVGADVVEYVPSPNPPGSDPAAARLVTKLLAWHEAARRVRLEA